MEESLDFIYKIQKELSILGGIAALLGWDQMTYMPPLGSKDRSEQSAWISRYSHEKLISDSLWNHIKKLINKNNFKKLSEPDKAVVKRLEKDIEKSRKIPSDFVERMSKTTTIAYTAWEDARKKKDFKIFSSHLEKIIELEKEYCSYINLPGTLYDNLLDDYEEGMTTNKLKKEFEFLKPRIIDILEKIKSSNIYINQKELKINFSTKQQEKLCKIVLKKFGIPKKRSRLDVSTHPFTTSMGYDDVRITTNFERKTPLFSFFSTIHEAGHALYELDMPRNEYENTVISDSPSLGLHESQSRFWENMIAKSIYFWNYFYEIIRKMYPTQFKNIDIEEWYRYINQVKPSLIRVEADELTYCLHIILRFEIEIALIEGEIKVSELPYLWNNKMQEMLDITPKNDLEGVLQDMHWSGGNFGYFPTYAIGTIYASQLFKKLILDNPYITREIETGHFKYVLNWLNENVHKYGRLITADEIIKNTCGEGLNSRIYINYLRDKYYKLYDL